MGPYQFWVSLNQTFEFSCGRNMGFLGWGVTLNDVLGVICTLQETWPIPATPLAATAGITGDIENARLESPVIPAVAANGVAGIGELAIRVLRNPSHTSFTDPTVEK
ncbi:hypothetical protein L2E82_13953 [Cichorium intybus]|uniref:Uncharacterized protein n=1 Tax=Cichorium intybus TaxID=13427 RepID=A0ACB9EZ92_CICIN|nr:hypothetical protein L2E82_13953 [Cichorium intybus]